MDMTTRSFGLLIAYLLPGFACALSLAFWFKPFEELLTSFVQSSSDFGSFLLFLLISLLLGLVLNALRWVVYEEIFLRKQQIPSDYFIQVVIEERLSAMHTAIDENFRYHQFYGGLSLVFPVFAWELTAHMARSKTCLFVALAALFSVLVEIVVICTATAAFRRYSSRSCAILQEMRGENAERIHDQR